MNETITFTQDGCEVTPTLKQRLGLRLIHLGGWLLKGSKPVTIEYRVKP